jgi:predicted dehydrogenase
VRCRPARPSISRHAESPASKATTHFEDLLASDVSAIVLATPAALHYAGARAALRAGKDVFVEKPLALRYHEGRELG